jgi:xanthosine utilization system XapX-like protein
MAVVLSLLVILAAIGFLFVAKSPNPYAPSVAVVAGILGQFVGAYCFYLYRQASRQVAVHYNRLSQVQDTMLAVHIGSQLNDGNLKDELTRATVLALLQRAGRSGPGPGEASPRSRRADAVNRDAVAATAPAAHSE